MSEEFKNVRRIQSVTRTNLTNELKTKMLGMATEDYSLGFKDSAGSMHWYTQEGGDAFFDSMELNFNGSAGYLAVDTQGRVILTNSNSSGSAAMSTGATAFDGLAINTDTTKFNVGAVKGYFVDNSSPETPIVTYKDFPAQLAITPTYLTTHNATFVGIDVDGTIIQSSDEFTPDEIRTFIHLGTIVHSNKTIINAINNTPCTSMSPVAQLHDLMESIGDFVVTGNALSPNGTNLNVNKSGGEIFKDGSNFVNDPSNPHILTLAGLTAPNTMRYRTQDGDEDGNTAVIDPTCYDLNGTKTTIPSTGWTVQRVYLFMSNLLRIQYGQKIYATKADALNMIGKDPFITEQNIADNGIHIAYIVVDNTCNDLSNITKCEIIQVGKFGTIIGSASTSVDTLQSAYDNSTTAEILTNAALGGLSIKNGETYPSATLLEIVDSGDHTNAYITANGDIGSVGYSRIPIRMGNDPEYAPYGYFGMSGGLQRHGLSIGAPGTLTITNAYSGNLANPESRCTMIGKKMADSKYAMMNIAENGKFYFGSNTDSVNMLKTATYSFIGDIGVGSNIGGPNASIRFTPSTGVDIDTTLRYTKYGLQWVNEYNGCEYVFYNYDYTSRTYTINSGGGGYYWINGVRYSVPLNTTFVTHSTTIGVHFIYIDSSNNLVTSMTPWDLNTDIVTLMSLYWTGSVAIPLFECHNKTRDRDWHSNAHTSIGTQAQVDGFGLININQDTATTDAQLRYGISTGWLKDEDIKITLDQLTDGGTSYNILYRSNSANGNLSIVNKTFPFQHGATFISYNNVATGAFVESANGRWVNYFVVGVPAKSFNVGNIAPPTSHEYRYLFVAGQASHPNLNAAQAEEFWTLSLGDLANFPEWVPLYRITYKVATALTTTYNVQVDDFKRYYVSRGSITGVGSTSTTIHNTLIGRDTVEAHPITAITGTATQVFFADASGNGSGSTNFVWDNVNSRLGLGISPAYDFDLLGSGDSVLSNIRNTKATPGSSAAAGLLMGNDITSARAGLYLYGSGQPTVRDAYADCVLLWNAGAGGITIATEAATPIRFFTGSTPTEKMQIAADGTASHRSTTGVLKLTSTTQANFTLDSPNVKIVMASQGTNEGGITDGVELIGGIVTRYAISGGGANFAVKLIASSGTTTYVYPIVCDLVNNGTASVSGRVTINGDINTTGVYRQGTVSRTGWTAASGTATRATFATSTVTTAQLAERVKALIDDLLALKIINA